jgi:hypothetical protein
MISCDMEQALVVLLSNFSHIVALIVGRPPAMVCAMLIRTFSTVEPSHCSKNADECTTAKDDKEDCKPSTESHGEDGM